MPGMPRNTCFPPKTDRSGEYVEHARISTVFGNALMPTLGFGHHEFAIHFGDIRVKTRVDGNAMQTFNLVVLTLVIGRCKACTRLQHAHLGRVFEAFRQQGDDGRIDIVD